MFRQLTSLQVRIWDAALVQEDIAKNMVHTIEEPLPAQLRVYFRFDGQAPNATDVSGRHSLQ